MPMELLAGSGDNIRAELLSMGVEIDPDSSKLLMKYLQVNVPSKKVHCATQVGWYKNNYVLPDEVIGPDSEAVIFQYLVI